jgi:hypothetical protein
MVGLQEVLNDLIGAAPGWLLGELYHYVVI